MTTNDLFKRDLALHGIQYAVKRANVQRAIVDAWNNRPPQCKHCQTNVLCEKCSLNK